MKKKKFLKNNSVINTIFCSVLIGIIISILLLLISSLIITKYDFQPSSRVYFWFVIAILSGFFTGICAGKMSKSKGIVWGALTGLIVASIIILVLFAMSEFSTKISVLILLPIYMLTSSVGSVISSNFR